MYKIGKKLLEAAEEIEKLKNIPKETFIRAICDSIAGAYRKKMKLLSSDSIHVQYDDESGEIGVFVPKTVVATVNDTVREIGLDEAKEYIPDVVEGEILELDVTPDDFVEFGRIAATTAKQIMTQRIREAEKFNLREEFKSKQYTTMAGSIKRIEYTVRGQPNVVVDLGSFDVQIPMRLQLQKENYKVGNRIRVYIQEYREDRKVPMIIGSHVHENLVKELFEIEVPEIEDQTVIIKSIAREAGQRTKIAVMSVSDDIDPVGACIGARGSRIQNVLSELRNEKIDIVRYSDDPVDFISNALSPAEVMEIALFDDKQGRRAVVTVAADQLSLAIGRGGQNVRLAAKLTGWKIDIKEAGSVKAVEPAEDPELEQSEVLS
ncbi:MAG: transcription termination factor NusA [Candidatus Caenarcaniphilales bacterium]|jgi:N utilization substance protein A|nr:transcription termination factor NusA [Candidatus Caenarcaniphilales bacterium]